MATGDTRDCVAMAAEAADRLMAERRKRMGGDALGAFTAPPQRDDAPAGTGAGRKRRAAGAAARHLVEAAADMALAGHTNVAIGQSLGVSRDAAQRLARVGLERRDHGLSDAQLVERYRGYPRGRPPAHVQAARDRIWAGMRAAGEPDCEIARRLGISAGGVSHRRLRSGGT